MAGITDVASAMFKFKKDWIYNNNGDKISDEDKEIFFFIYNRLFSKLYPEKAQLLNLKNIDKVLAMDLWFHFMKTQPYPSNFWSKTHKQEKELPEKDYKLLLKGLKVDQFDLDYLIEKFPDFIKEELTYYKKLEKGN
jgi:hypothetical protein